MNNVIIGHNPATVFTYRYIYSICMGHAARKADFVVCEHQRHTPSCDSAQSDLRLNCLFCVRYNSLSCYMQNVNIQVGLCSCQGWIYPFEDRLMLHLMHRYYIKYF